MSTYWYFECLDHDPPLRSADEFTQHTDDLWFRGALELAAARPLDEDWYDHLPDGYFTRNAARFLAAHPECRLGIVNEYGEHSPVPTDTREKLAEDGRRLAPKREDLLPTRGGPRDAEGG